MFLTPYSPLEASDKPTLKATAPPVGADHAHLGQEDLPDWRLYEFLTTTDWQRVAALLD